MERHLILALALVATAAVWLIRSASHLTDDRAVGEAGGPRSTTPAAPRSSEPVGRGEILLLAGSRDAPREPVAADPPQADPRSAPPEVLTPLGPVLVRGSAFFGVLPADGVALAARDAAGEEIDWDFTDRDGSFELRLPPATYRIVHDDLEDWSSELVVSSGGGDVEVALLLPPTLLDGIPPSLR